MQISVKRGEIFEKIFPFDIHRNESAHNKYWNGCFNFEIRNYSSYTTKNMTIEHRKNSFIYQIIVSIMNFLTQRPLIQIDCCSNNEDIYFQQQKN